MEEKWKSLYHAIFLKKRRIKTTTRGRKESESNNTIDKKFREKGSGYLDAVKLRRLKKCISLRLVSQSAYLDLGH